MNSKRKILIAGGLVAAVAASGGAFTAGIDTPSNQVVGAGTNTVTGGTVDNIDYVLTGGDISSVVVDFADDYTIETDFAMTVQGQAYNGSLTVVGDVVTFLPADAAATAAEVQTTTITVTGEKVPQI